MDENTMPAPPRLYTLPELAREAGRGERSISFLVRQYETVTGHPLPRRQRRNFMERVLNQSEYDLLLKVMRAYDKAPGEHSYLDLIRKHLGQSAPVVPVDPDPAASTIAALLVPVFTRLDEVMERLAASPAPGQGSTEAPSATAIRAEAMTRMVNELLTQEPVWITDLRVAVEAQGKQLGDLREDLRVAVDAQGKRLGDLRADLRSLTAELTALRGRLPENLAEVPGRLEHLSRLIENELSGGASVMTEEVAS